MTGPTENLVKSCRGHVNPGVEGGREKWRRVVTLFVFMICISKVGAS